MSQTPHDHNFKNIFLDFPKETLAWLLPDAVKSFGEIKGVEFVRQEPKKQKLTDAHFALDMPILFTFEKGRLLLWLVEFQEDKLKFSIYKLGRYTMDLTEAYPDAMVVPMVLFTDRKRWRKDVQRQIQSEWHGRIFLHFEYIFIKLFDFKAKDFYHYKNPVVKILLPKMDYPPEARFEVIRRAYQGLFELAAPLLFEKYIDFIDIYSEIEEDERIILIQELEEHKETAMLAQYIREEGRQEGRQEGKQETQLAIAKKMLDQGFSIEKIVELIGLTPEQLSKENIQKYISKNKVAQVFNLKKK